ncbi:TonB-dependent receptor [Desulfobulbus rhabdoformis]|uniref:TonB-dependent receptor n=1 Tax=Desulfobulbus rhabdoformis TaxID=34032 RepID=UPI001963A2A9|nr:TonB-dependent receptor [Desulfobulbus rhabdoformis]MBM9616731.1 TonB-dependent receptor [Desulfobulbus rhabdoformis]
MSCCTATSGMAGEQDKTTLETMTVTAQKQEEDIQNVSMGVTALDDQAIEDIKIESVAELADYIPNLMIYKFGMEMTSQPTMRGISASANSENATAVGLFVDGVPTLSTAGYEEGFVDIERIEVLRGPQGTLYGKNTEAGAINIITRQPDNTFRGRISTELGEDNRRKGVLSLSGPLLEDNLFFSIAGEYGQKDGYVKDSTTGGTLDDREHWFGRGKLRWTPLENLDISLIVSRLSHEDGGVRMNLTPEGAASLDLAAPEDRKMGTNVALYRDTDSDLQALKAVYDINDSYSLTSITARKTFTQKTSNDWDFTTTEMMEKFSDSENHMISQELRLNGNTGKLKWIAGLYYDDNSIERTIQSALTAAVQTDREINGDSYAVFGQASYFLSPQINLVGGLRFEEQNMEYEDHVMHTSRDDSWSDISPKVALEYHMTPEIMSYFSIAKGYRSGGFNQLASDERYASYDEETLWSYELGVKSTFFDRRLVVNGAVYYMDINDMQVEESVDPSEAYVTNAAEATAIGAELEINARVAKGLTLTAGFGYCDITFDKYKDRLGDYEGNHNLYAPDYTFSLGAQYRHSSGMYARADLLGYGKMYFDKANKYSRDPYELVNLKIGYEWDDFDLYLYGKNIFDREYDSVGYYNGHYTIYSDPREVGIQLTYRF